MTGAGSTEIDRRLVGPLLTNRCSMRPAPQTLRSPVQPWVVSLTFDLFEGERPAGIKGAASPCLADRQNELPSKKWPETNRGPAEKTERVLSGDRSDS
jgi:hypothetical protein